MRILVSFFYFFLISFLGTHEAKAHFTICAENALLRIQGYPPKNPEWKKEIDRMDSVLTKRIAEDLKSLPELKRKRIQEYLENVTIEDDTINSGIRRSPRGGVTMAVNLNFSIEWNFFLTRSLLSHPFSRIAYYHEFTHLMDFIPNSNEKLDIISVILRMFSLKNPITAAESIAFKSQYHFTRELYQTSDLERLKTMIAYNGIDEIIEKLIQKNVLQKDPSSLSEIFLISTEELIQIRKNQPAKALLIRNYIDLLQNRSMYEYIEKALQSTEEEYIQWALLRYQNQIKMVGRARGGVFVVGGILSGASTWSAYEYLKDLFNSD